MSDRQVSDHDPGVAVDIRSVPQADLDAMTSEQRRILGVLGTHRVAEVLANPSALKAEADQAEASAGDQRAARDRLGETLARLADEGHTHYATGTNEGQDFVITEKDGERQYFRLESNGQLSPSTRQEVLGS